MHILAFTDMLASIDKRACTFTLTEKSNALFCQRGHTCFCMSAVCVLFMFHLSLTALRQKTRPSKLSVCFITSCNLHLSTEPGQSACAKIQPFLKTVRTTGHTELDKQCQISHLPILDLQFYKEIV